MAIPIAVLLPGESPRSEGPDAEHVARLVELETPLPPILVERRTMRVIDGMHRLMAAFLKGHETIDVEFFDGTSEEAFLRAVEANIAHGLPLSQEDRRTAAARIVSTHPQMSDRAIARASGLGAKAVAAIRRRSTDARPQLNARVGRDGKIRPLNSVEGRRRAAELLVERPEASLREVARLAGISPATVGDVRRRLAAGEMPAAEHAGPDRVVGDTVVPSVVTVPSVPRQAARKMRLVEPDPASVLEKLLRDPSLRHKEEGRHLLRLLRQNAIDTREWSKLAAAVPAHCGDLIVGLARQYADMWTEFAQDLDLQVRGGAAAASSPAESSC
ncbi:transcriptional regulator [Kitasatospora purpeofusca]|uniref:transcriptional regulator n=1 Tax=Kitasatospora purpeofusca TaxID=67352 RepID=UPI0035E1B968